MILAFLRGIFEYGKETRTSTDIKPDVIFQDFISDVGKSFSLICLRTAPYPRTTAKLARCHMYASHVGRDMGFLFCTCSHLGLHAELGELVSTIVSEAAERSGTNEEHVWIFDDVYLPILKTFVEMLEEMDISVENSPFQSLFQQLLGLYIIKYVEEEPVAEKDWARNAVDCDCKNCAPLNEFHLSPTKTSRSFKVATTFFNHFSDMTDHLYWGECECCVDVEQRVFTLTKNRGGYEADHEKWLRHHNEAHERLSELDSPTFKRLLGNLHEAIMSQSVPALEIFLNDRQAWKLSCSRQTGEDKSVKDFSEGSTLEDPLSPKIAPNAGSSETPFEISGVREALPKPTTDAAERVWGAEEEELASVEVEKAFSESSDLIDLNF